jgi:hypothetical protein
VLPKIRSIAFTGQEWRWLQEWSENGSEPFRDIRGDHVATFAVQDADPEKVGLLAHLLLDHPVEVNLVAIEEGTPGQVGDGLGAEAHIAASALQKGIPAAHDGETDHGDGE